MIRSLLPRLLSDPRYRRSAASAGAGAVSAVVFAVLNLVAVPVLLAALGPERFGLWMALYSLVAMLSFLDLGVGLGLITLLAKANGSGDRAAARRYVTAAFTVTIGLGLVLATLIVVVSGVADLGRLLGARSPSTAVEAEQGALALGLWLAVAIPANLAARIHSGYQQGYIPSLFEVGARLTVLAAVVLLAGPRLDLPLLASLFVGLPVVFAATNLLILMARWRPDLRPATKQLDTRAVKQVAGSGGLYLILQVIVALAFQSDILVVSHVLGPAAVADFSVPRTLFNTLNSAAMLLLLPLWPAYGEALARGDTAWIKRTLRWSVGGVFVLTLLGGLVLVGLAGPVMRAWVGHVPALVDLPLLLGLAVWVALSTTGAALAMAMNAANLVRFQIATGLLLVIGAVPAKIVLAHHYSLAGVVWGTIAVYLVTTLAPTLVYVQRWLRRPLVQAGPAASEATGGALI